MFKIVSSEIKKIVAKPGIYILSVLLAVILILGVLIYKPTVYESTQFQLNGSTFLEKYADFAPNSSAGKKAESDSNLDAVIQAVNNYSISGKSQQEVINNLLNTVNENYANYQNCANNNSYQAYIDSVRKKYVTSLKELNTTIDNAFINSQQGSYTILSTTENYNDYKKSYKEVIEWAELSVEKSKLNQHFATFEEKYESNFYESISHFKYPTLSAEQIKTYTQNTNGTKLYILKQRIGAISNEIEANKTLATANKNNENVLLADKMDELANDYVNTINTYVQLVKYELICNAFSSISTKEHLNTLHLSQHSNYNSKSLLTRYEYLFEHNKSDNDYSKPLTIGITSNPHVNGYDYAYFVLKIFSFVIIIYAIMSSCHSIAGEVKDGTMRYLAIRPVSRTQMLMGKWLAILIMSSILIIFSSIISVCVGWALYDLTANTILTIFNGSIAITLHPLAMIAIYLVSMLLELIVYSAIAMLVSTLFKSDLLGMTLMMMLYLVNILLPMFVQGSNTWLAFYPFSHLSLYSLFGSSVYAVPTNFFNLIFGAKVYAGTHIALTLSLIAIVVALVGGIAIRVFKKKEL